MRSETNQKKETAVQRSREVDPLYQEALLVEYKATQDKIAHDDKITWQRGTILIAAVIASLAIVATNLLHIHFLILLGVAGWFTGIITIWYLWDRRLQSEVELKFKRLHEIEIMLELKQHLMIHEADKKKERKGPTGRMLAKCLIIWVIAGWWLLAIGGLILQLLG